MNVVKTVHLPFGTIEFLQHPTSRLIAFSQVPNMAVVLANEVDGKMEPLYMNFTALPDSSLRNHDGGIVGQLLAGSVVDYCNEMGLKVLRRPNDSFSRMTSMRPSQRSNKETTAEEEEQMWSAALGQVMVAQIEELMRGAMSAMGPRKPGSLSVEYMNGELQHVLVQHANVGVSLRIEPNLPEDLLEANRQTYQMRAQGQEIFDSRAQQGLLFVYPGLKRKAYVRGYVIPVSHQVRELGVESMFEYQTLEHLMVATLKMTFDTIAKTA